VAFFFAQWNAALTQWLIAIVPLDTPDTRRAAFPDPTEAVAAA